MSEERTAVGLDGKKLRVLVVLSYLPPQASGVASRVKEPSSRGGDDILPRLVKYDIRCELAASCSALPVLCFRHARHARRM